MACVEDCRPRSVLKQPAGTPVWRLKATLYCQACSEAAASAHVLRLTYYGRPDSEPSRMAKRRLPSPAT